MSRKALTTIALITIIFILFTVWPPGHKLEDTFLFLAIFYGIIVTIANCIYANR